MYKQDLVLNNPEGLIFRKTQDTLRQPQLLSLLAC